MMSCDSHVMHNLTDSVIEGECSNERVNISNYEDYLFTVTILSSMCCLVDPSLYYDTLQHHDHLVGIATLSYTDA